MQINDSWLLPEGISEVLPDQALALENLRRILLDSFSRWGYQLVIPPFVDFLDSLLTGSGHDLQLQTFTVTDQISGKMLGVRADMTPQVARIDAHNLKHDWPTRLCYAGTVLNTLGDSLEKTRSPMQIGAELYGHSGIESDYEIICLMLETLALSQLQQVHLDVGHVALYRALTQHAQLSDDHEAQLFEILQRKAMPELTQLLADWPLTDALKNAFAALPKLNGDRTVLTTAAQVLPTDNAVIQQALADLNHLADQLARDFPALTVSFDLAELRGYHYHTGLVFAAFVPGVGKEIARGGRYDNIGAVFGRARAATGFSADLHQLSRLSPISVDSGAVVFAPADPDPTLAVTVRDLRANGTVVIQQLHTQSGSAHDMGCTAILEKHEQHWLVKPLTQG